VICCMVFPRQCNVLEMLPLYVNEMPHVCIHFSTLNLFSNNFLNHIEAGLLKISVKSREGHNHHPTNVGNIGLEQLEDSEMMILTRLSPALPILHCS
jgi:hypothetical protein